MKKVLGFLCLLLLFGVSFATVGGPTIIGNMYYDSSSNNIRYSKTFYDGLGGSEVHKYSVAQGKDELIITLENLEFAENRLMSDISTLEDYFQRNKYSKLKEFQINKLPIKISLNLKYFNELINSESFEIAKVAPHPFTEDEYMMSGYIFNFIWENKVSLENQLKSQIELSTCRLDPINYRGFGLENIDTILIIATTAKKDCMEGGYLGESIHILSGVNIDKERFLPENKDSFEPSAYYANPKLQASTGGLRIEPKITGNNEVSGILTTQTQDTTSLLQKIMDILKKIFGLFMS